MDDECACKACKEIPSEDYSTEIIYKPPNLEKALPYLEDSWVLNLKKTPTKKILPSMGIKKVSQEIPTCDNLGE